MSKFMLSVALGLASLGGFARAEMPLSPVTSAAAFYDSGFQYFRSQPTYEAARRDAEYWKEQGSFLEYRLVQNDDGSWAIWARRP